MPDGVAQVQAEIEAREHRVHAFPLVQAERDAVGRRAVDAPGRKVADACRPVAQWMRRGDRMPGRRALDVGRHDAHLAEFRRRLGQRRQPRAMNAVVVGDEQAHELSLGRTKGGRRSRARGKKCKRAATQAAGVGPRLRPGPEWALTQYGGEHPLRVGAATCPARPDARADRRHSKPGRRRGANRALSTHDDSRSLSRPAQ